MSEFSEAYLVTERLHASFFGRDSKLSTSELASSGIHATIGSSSSRTVERIEAEGEVNGRRAKQTLAKDRLGNFHFSTTYYAGEHTRDGGEHIQTDIRPNSPPEAFEPIANSLFMSAMIELALDT